jgi:hypothetical protein
VDSNYTTGHVLFDGGENEEKQRIITLVVIL